MIEQKLLAELKEKMGLYTFAWDENMPENFDNLLTQNLVFEVWQPLKKELLYRVDGVEALKQMHALMIGGLLNSGGVARHNLSETVVMQASENEIKTKTPYYFSAFMQRNEFSPMMITGTFNDTWVKTETGWKVSERIIIYDNLPDAILQQFKK